jgi:hypothetical protein
MIPALRARVFVSEKIARHGIVSTMRKILAPKMETSPEAMGRFLQRSKGWIC